MLNTVLCKLNLGHHWVTEKDQDGTFRKHCSRCGKYDRRTATWTGHLAPGDRPPQHGSREFF